MSTTFTFIFITNQPIISCSVVAYEIVFCELQLPSIANACLNPSLSPSLTLSLFRLMKAHIALTPVPTVPTEYLCPLYAECAINFNCLC